MVKWVKLGDEGSFYSGLSGKSKNDFVNGNAKFVTYMNVYTNAALNFDIEDRVQINDTERQNTIEYGDILFTGSSETPDECGMSCVVTHAPEESIYLNSFCFGYRFNSIENIQPDYCKHLFRSNMIRSAIAKTANGVTRFNVSKKLFANIEIPLPSLSEQQRIVDILDKFEGMVENVEKELQLRQKQYEVYREKVIFSIPIIRKVCKLSEIAEIKNGKDYKHLSDGNIPVWGTGGIMTYVDTFAYDKASVLLPRKGSIENIYYTEKPFWTVDTLFYTEIDESVVVPKYFFYYMSIIDLSSYNTSVGNRPSLTKTVLDNIEIPIPYLDKQQEIVAKLDKFEELIANLKEELELRKKQYEYYREKLLTFE